MTESDWLASSDPGPMLEFVRGTVDDRKVRLFQVACCRRIWNLMPDDACREAVELAERYADGETTDRRRVAMRKRMNLPTTDLFERWTRGAAYETLEKTVMRRLPFLGVPVVFGEVARRKAFGASSPRGFGDPAVYRRAYDAERAAEARLVRCLCGNPFRPVAAVSSWRTDKSTSLARAMYDSRDFSALLKLADALRKGGCKDGGILAHCREEGPHARGCWVVDWVLEKGCK